MSPESPIPKQPAPEDDDVPTFAVMRIAEGGGAFDFWLGDGEDIYTVEDGDPLNLK